jgi:protein TonB
MQRRQPDASIHALNAAGARSAEAVDVVVLSEDDALLRTLREAASATHEIWHAPTADAAVELLIGGHCGILIADLSVLQTGATALLEKLLAQFPEIVLLATGRRDQEGAVGPLITRGSIYRFLHKPVSPARAGLFLSAATRRYHELSSTTSPALASVRKLTRSSGRTAWLIGSAVVLLSAAAFLFFARTSESPASSTAPTSVADEPSFDGQLEAARAAFEAGHLVEPAGDNALNRYRAVLAADAGNAVALAGERQVIDALRAEVSTALRVRDVPGAARALKVLQQAAPADPQLGSLSQQVIALSRTLSVEPVASAAPTVSRAQSSAAKPPTNNDLARQRLADSQLLGPDGDNALFFLRQAHAQNEEDSTTRILATDLGSRLIDQTNAAVANGNVEEAQTLYASVTEIDREFGLTLPDLAEAGRAIEALQASQARAASAAVMEALAPAIRMRETGQLLEPASGNAFETLQAIATRYPDSAEVRSEKQRLAFTLVEHSRTALVEGDLDRAELLAVRANDLVPGMNTVQTLRQQIASAVSSRAAQTVVNAGSIERVGGAAAVYPPDALRRGLEGWVDLEFTIAADGSTRDIQVRESRPGGVFNRAATDALRTWRYKPVLRNGQPVDQRAQLRMQFTLE